MVLPIRKSPRRSIYDYRSSGMYFITICTADRQPYFGNICFGNMIISEIGRIFEEQFYIMLSKRPWIELHEYIIMPDHIHLLFFMDNDISSWKLDISDGISDMASPVSADIINNIKNQSLWSVIWWLKSAVSKICNERWLEFARQSRYHDRIVRNENEYNNIKYYIQQNPTKRKSI